MKLSNVDANCKSMVIKVKVSRRVKVENMLPFERVLFGRIIELGDIPKVELLSGSSMLRRMIIESHGFIIVPPFKREVLDGEVLEMNLFKPINLQ
jgi:molybdopterin biosynthesis enzyme